MFHRIGTPKAEMSEIMAVSANTVNYASSTPIPKIYFDALTGGYILTKEFSRCLSVLR